MVNYLDSQAFSPTLAHQDGLELAALYTLQHGLPRNPEFDGSFQHRQIIGRGLLHNPCPQLRRDTNLPRRAGRDLLAGDEAVGQPTVNRGSVQAQDLGRLSDRRYLSLRWLSRRSKAGDVAIAAQTTDLIGREALTGGSFASLTIED